MDLTQTKNLDWAPILTGETLLLGLLGKMIYSEPEEAWIKQLMDEDIFSEVPLGKNEEESQQGLEILRKWIVEQNGRLSGAALMDIKVDYLALFIGPGTMKAPLWESIYFTKDHLLFQNSTLKVRQWYRRFGLEPELLNQEPDDHLGLELLFMAHLSSLGLNALESGNTVLFNQYMTSQKKFYSKHLLKWGPVWAKLVIENSKTDFYRGIGYLTLGSLLAVAHVLQLPIPVQALE